MDKEDEPGRFVSLKETMANKGFPKIVNILSGQAVTDENYRHLLDVFADEVIHRIDPTALISYLVKYEVISTRDAEDVRAEERNHGKINASWVLLDCLPKRHDDWFKLFLVALVENRSGRVAEMLDEDLYQKIQIQRTHSEESRREEIYHDEMEYVTEDTNVATSPRSTEVNVMVAHEDSDATILLEASESRDVSVSEVVDDTVLTVPKAGEATTTDDRPILEQTGADNNVVMTSQNTEVNDMTVHEDADVTRLVEALESTDIMEASESTDMVVSQYTDETSGKVPRAEDVTTMKDAESTVVVEQKAAIHTQLDNEGTIIAVADAAYINTAKKEIDGTKRKHSFFVQECKLDTNTQTAEIINDLNRGERGRTNNNGGKVTNVDMAVDSEAITYKPIADIDKIEVGTAYKGKYPIVSEVGPHAEEPIYERNTNEMNISTDMDELVNTEENYIKLRDYQQELAAKGCEGENVVVVAPTNTGKTWVACRIMQEHFRRRHQLTISKAVFIVENEALADQQAKVMAELLPTLRTKVISGKRQREKNESLTSYIGRRDILVVTAQIVVNALRDKDIEGVSVFSMIVFDECHHASSDHPYNEIMRHYMDQKLAGAADLPQIIGLTASMGCGGNSAIPAAIDHMKGLMANLDAKEICTVKENRLQLLEFMQPPYEEIVIAPNRLNDVFGTNVTQVMRNIENWLATHESITNLGGDTRRSLMKIIAKSPPTKGTEQYIQWLNGDFKTTIVQLDSEDARRFLNNSFKYVEDYNRALMLYKDARAEDALAYLADVMEDRQTNPLKDATETEMLQFYEDLRMMSIEGCSFNPKLVNMKEVVLDMLANREDARGIIFVRTKALAHALIAWMKDDADLTMLNPIVFVGQTASASAGGITKTEQKNTLDYFKDGKHKLIVATSVAEEGLDIAKCNLVIRFEHVTNEIVRLQSRGRARAPGSKYYVITEKGSPIAEKEEWNALLEPVMNEAVKMLQSAVERRPNSWEAEVLERQTKDKTRRSLAETRRSAATVDGECELQCFHCGNFICMSYDLRKVQNNHRIIITDVNENVLYTRSLVPEFEDHDFKHDGTLFCRRCGEVLGGVCEFMLSEFPVLKIKTIRVVDRLNKGDQFAKWKNVKGFVVKDITIEDLSEIVRRRLNDA